jgi:hypothetical protein
MSPPLPPRHTNLQSVDNTTDQQHPCDDGWRPPTKNLTVPPELRRVAAELGRRGTCLRPWPETGMPVDGRCLNHSLGIFGSLYAVDSRSVDAD